MFTAAIIAAAVCAVTMFVVIIFAVATFTYIAHVQIHIPVHAREHTHARAHTHAHGHVIEIHQFALVSIINDDDLFYYLYYRSTLPLLFS